MSRKPRPITNVDDGAEPCRTCGGTGRVCEEVIGYSIGDKRVVHGPCDVCSGTGSRSIILFVAGMILAGGMAHAGTYMPTYDDAPPDCEQVPFDRYARMVDKDTDPVELYRLYFLTHAERCGWPTPANTFADKGITDADLLAFFMGDGSPVRTHFSLAESSTDGEYQKTPEEPAPVPLPATGILLACALFILRRIF
jgi:hypothetical protein